MPMMAFIARFGTVRQMAEHVGRAKLVLRVQPVGHEIVGPAGQQGPVLPGELGVALGAGQGRQNDEHVAAFLDRHAAAVASAHAVDLARGVRIGSQVVRGIAVGPRGDEA